MILVDASALIEVLLGSSKGAELESILTREELVAPELLDVEVASGLARLERASILTPEDADRAIARLEALPLERIGHRLLARDAFRRRHSIRVTDAFYVSCAHFLNAPILTLDQRLIRAAPEGVRFLSLPG